MKRISDQNFQHIRIHNNKLNYYIFLTLFKMITNPCIQIYELDLDQQLADTHKLKQCISDFSARLQKAQERLLEEDASTKIRNSLMITQKITSGHVRRHNSHNPSLSTLHTQKNSISMPEPENKEQIDPVTKEISTPKDNRHYRKLSACQENPEQKFKSLDLPISPSQAYRHFKYLLSPYEQGEVLEYNEIYYLGLSSQKIKNYSVNMNYGYDDERGDYKVIIGDHIAYRYEVLSVLGKGSFGQVVKLLDHKSKQELALKIIRNKVRFHQQAEVEIKVLKLISEADKKNRYNVVHLKDSLVFRNHSCIVFEILGCSLYDTLKTNNFKGINIRYIKRYAYQILQSLYLLSKLNLIHCDLKPENILLSLESKSCIKVVDFGSSCYRNSRMYTYIQSRFYRAPEIILGLEYAEAIDIWSLGCILVELYTGFPLFPGENEADLFNCMVEVLGVPPKSFSDRSSRKSMYFNSKNEVRVVPNSKGKKRYPGNRSLNEILKGVDIEFIEFIESKKYLECLEWEPDKRITPSEGLEHVCFKKTNKKLSTGPVSKWHRYHLSDTQFNHSSYNRIFHPPQTEKFIEKGFAF
jgi:dual specificity tyrosine-phosphorylation-regulated kinase 2/3/4